MASDLTLSTLFITAEEYLPAGGELVLDTESEAGGSQTQLESCSSGLLEHLTDAALAGIPLVDDLPSQDGAAAVDSGFDGDDFQGVDSPPRAAAPLPDANKRCAGGLAGMGGRPEGTGLRTRENFRRAAQRVLSEGLHLRGCGSLLNDPRLGVIEPFQRQAFSSLIDSWRSAAGKEEVWAIQYFFGVFARFSVWGKTDHGKRSACCTWLAADGRVRCTCVGSDVYNSDVGVGRPSTCEHISGLDAAMERMADALGCSVVAFAVCLHVLMGDSVSVTSDTNGEIDAEAPVWRFHRDIVVVVAVQRGVALPVPVHLPKRGVSCGFCVLSGTRGCSHTATAEQYRTTNGSVPQVTSSSCPRSSVSTRPLSLFNCPGAIAFDRLDGDLARYGGTYVLEAPEDCTLCGASMKSSAGDGDTSFTGLMHSTLGPCAMRVIRRQCGTCKEHVTRDGREERLLLLSLTSGCTVAWARKCAEFVRSGTHISDVLTQCYSDWAGLKRAGLLPLKAKWRAADTLRALILTLMRLSVADPDRGLYECSVCMLPCRRYLVVTADCICLGFDAQAQPFTFEHVCEVVPPVNNKGREGCLVVGEQARRMLRHVLVPDDPAAVTDRTLRSAELALSCLFPVENGPDGAAADVQSRSAASIRVLLSAVWKVEAAALPLAESLLLAYERTQVKSPAEQKRRADKAVLLKASIVKWRAANPDAVKIYADAVKEVRATKKAEAEKDQADADDPSGGDERDAQRRPPSRPARRQPRPKRQRGRKNAVKPGEEPALNIPKPLLQPLLLGLDNNDVDHICRMVLAFTLDPVIAGVKVRHFVGMIELADALLTDKPRARTEAFVAEATRRTRAASPLSPGAKCLSELRHILVALQAAALVFDLSPSFAQAIANVFNDAVACARAFYAELAVDVRGKHQYMERYLRDCESEEELLAAFRKRYPTASSSATATGVYTPGRDQCRAEPFDKADKTPCGTCEKGFNSSERYSDGALTLCCACAHPKILGFVVLDRKESPQVLINALLTRFPRLPRYLVYDFACGVVRCAMAKLPWMMRDLCVVSDRFHVCNHTCLHFYNANSYGDLDYKNTLTHEQRNAAIRRMEKILRGAGRYGYLALLCYQTSILNSFAESKSVFQQEALAAAARDDECLARLGSAGAHDAAPTAKPRVSLPPHFDLRADYFRRHPCRCCGYSVGAPAGAG